LKVDGREKRHIADPSGPSTIDESVTTADNRIRLSGDTPCAARSLF